MFFRLDQLSENVMEHDVSGLVLSVCMRMNQPFVDETGVKRVLYAEEPQPPPSSPSPSPPSSPPPQTRTPSSVEPTAFRASLEKTVQHDGRQPAVGGSVGVLSLKVDEVEEGDEICLRSIIASTEVQKGVLPEMLRAQECMLR